MESTLSTLHNNFILAIGNRDLIISTLTVSPHKTNLHFSSFYGYLWQPESPLSGPGMKVHGFGPEFLTGARSFETGPSVFPSFDFMTVKGGLAAAPRNLMLKSNSARIIVERTLFQNMFLLIFIEFEFWFESFFLVGEEGKGLVFET